MKLYEITDTIMQMVEMMDEAVQAGDGETAQACMDTLDSLEYDLSEKLERMSKIVRNNEADIKALKDEAKRLSDRAKTAERQNDILKGYMKEQMEKAGKTKMDAGIFKVSIAQNGGVRPIQVNVEASELPPCFQTVTIAPNTAAIRKYLEEDHDPTGYFEFKERGTSLRIR